MTDAVQVVESEVRELIRRSGLDPARHPLEVGRLVDDVIADYDERSLHGGMPPIIDRLDTAKQVMDVVAGFGPLQRYLDDPTVEEVWINEPSKVFVARRGIAELTTTILTADEVRDLVERMLRTSGRRVDLSSPFVDATLPDGSRLHVVIPDITRDHWHVNVRKMMCGKGASEARRVALDAPGTLDTRASRLGGMADETPRIDPPPSDLLAFLDSAEKRLNDVDELRDQIHRLRETLVQSPPPTAAEVVSEITYDVSLSDRATATDELRVTVHQVEGRVDVMSSVFGSADVVAKGEITVTGRVSEAVTGSVSEASLPTPWSEWARAIGPTVVQFVRLVWEMFGKPKLGG